MNSRQLNAARFLGFADAYDKARPACPPQILEIARVYRGFPPRTVADVGCGTGLSTLAWAEAAREVVGIEPSPDMRAAAERAAAGCPNVRIQPGYGDDTCLPDGWADVVACSQSFHWMEPASTLKEAARILQPGGLFMAYDYDTVPLCNRRAETAYQVLLAYIRRMEDTHPAVRGSAARAGPQPRRGASADPHRPAGRPATAGGVRESGAGRSGRSALPHDLQLPAAPGDPPGHGSRHIKSPLSYRLWKEARAAGDCLWGGLFSVRKKPSGTAANKKGCITTRTNSVRSSCSLTIIANLRLRLIALRRWLSPVLPNIYFFNVYYYSGKMSLCQLNFRFFA